MRGRSVAISVSTFIIYAQNNTYKALVRERSKKVAVHQNLLHIICHYVDSYGGDNRYAINVSECWALQEQYDQESINEKRHQQLVRLSVLVAVLGAVLGFALIFWFSR